MTTIIVLWLFAGVFSCRITHQSFKRDWYLRFKEDYWSSSHKPLPTFLIACIAFILGGLLSLIIIVIVSLINGIKPVFYFNPKDLNQ